MSPGGLSLCGALCVCACAPSACLVRSRRAAAAAAASGLASPLNGHGRGCSIQSGCPWPACLTGSNLRLSTPVPSRLFLAWVARLTSAFLAASHSHFFPLPIHSHRLAYLVPDGLFPTVSFFLASKPLHVSDQHATLPPPTRVALLARFLL